mmetsp:Transcript_4812/g.15575  ORF Transcript_4812/g.15575 Transcript_4812/m.15575 type:complete len:174 (+) Transcript_4812:1-522(+)
MHERHAVVSTSQSLDWRDGISFAAVSTLAFLMGQRRCPWPWAVGACGTCILASLSFRHMLGFGKVDMKRVNRVAETYCQRIKNELLAVYRNKIAHSLFSYLDGQIMFDVRVDLRQQIREVDAKQVDEDIRAKEHDLKLRSEEAQRMLAHIRRVRKAEEDLSEDYWLQVDSEAQ